jgi:5-methyltetrahydrofolate--homocysteine methyltransferase
MSRERRLGYVAEVRSEYARLAAAHARGEEQKKRLTLAAARANALKLDWSGAYQPPRPSFLGRRVFTGYDLRELVPYIDWSPFFSTWELVGKYPAILDDATVGPAARTLFDDAQAMLETIIREGWFRADALLAFWPAATQGDDILVHADEARTAPMLALHTLRQQLARREGRANVALADFIAPADSGLADHIGAFVVTAGIGEEQASARFKHANDDYSAIMVKALADRLAEAFAERLHERVRREFWGYAPDEALTPADRLAEKYRGIRPAPGYPAQPDHTEKAPLFAMVGGGEAIGVTLTESFAMWPSASVSGLYFSHPQSHYFGVGKIERDQVEDYAQRKGWSVVEAEKWLAPVLNYDPRTDGPRTAATSEAAE